MPATPAPFLPKSLPGHSSCSGGHSGTGVGSCGEVGRARDLGLPNRTLRTLDDTRANNTGDSVATSTVERLSSVVNSGKNRITRPSLATRNQYKRRCQVTVTGTGDRRRYGEVRTGSLVLWNDGTEIPERNHRVVGSHRPREKLSDTEYPDKRIAAGEGRHYTG